MKAKFLLPFVIIFFAKPTLKAQISEGRYILGGGASMNSESSPKYNAESGSLQIGKVIKNNTIIGIFGSVYLSTDSANGTLQKGNQFNIGVFYRKYKSLGNKFYFFGEVDVSFQYFSNKVNYLDSGTPPQHQFYGSESNSGILNFIPGISYSVYKRMQIELTMPNIVNIGYGNAQINGSLTPTSRANNFSVSANLNSNFLSNFGIGFKFFLGK